MKKLIWLLIILFIVILCSCTSSGKLTDAKFPFALYFEGYIANKYPLPIDQTTGAKIMGTYYLKADFTPTASTKTIPPNVGSYTIKASLTDWAALKRQQDKYDMYVYSFLIGFLLICFLIIGWAFWRKDEEITIPDDTTLKL